MVMLEMSTKLWDYKISQKLKLNAVSSIKCGNGIVVSYGKMEFPQREEIEV